MKVTKSQAKRLGTAISEWETTDLISTETAGRLRGSLEIVGFDWKRLAKYSFWTSVICVVIAVGALLADEIIEPLLESVFGSVFRGYGVVFGAVGAALFCLGIYRRQRKPEGTWSNEAVFLLGVLSVAASLVFWCVDLEYERFSLFMLAPVLSIRCWGCGCPQNLSGFSRCFPSEAGSALRPATCPAGVPTISV